MNPGLLGRLGVVASRVFVGFWFVFLLAPIAITVIASLNAAPYLIFPPRGISLVWYRRVLELSWFRATLVNSAVIACVSVAISVVAGLLAARALVRHRFRGRAVLEYLVLTPLVIPGVVLGFALLNFVLLIGTKGFPLANLIAAHVLVTIPFTLRATWSSMAGMDLSLEEAAQSLGATPWRTFWHVTFPMILPGVVAGAILAAAYSFNDVTISIFLVARETTTLPVELMAHIEYQPDPTPAAVSSIMILLTLAFFLVIQRTVGLRVFTDR